MTPKVQAVDKRDLFYKRNVYDYYKSSDDLPHRERYVYNPYEIARPIFALKRDKELPTTTNWRNFCKKAGWFCMMKRNNLGTDTSLNQYSKDEFFSKLLGRLFKSQKILNNNNPTTKNVILVNVSCFSSNFCVAFSILAHLIIFLISLSFIFIIFNKFSIIVWNVL